MERFPAEMKLNNRANLSEGLPNLKKLSNARKMPIGRRKEEKSRHLEVNVFLLGELEFWNIAQTKNRGRRVTYTNLTATRRAHQKDTHFLFFEFLESAEFTAPNKKQT